MSWIDLQGVAQFLTYYKEVLTAEKTRILGQPVVNSAQLMRTMCSHYLSFCLYNKLVRMQPELETEKFWRDETVEKCAIGRHKIKQITFISPLNLSWFLYKNLQISGVSQETAVLFDFLGFQLRVTGKL